MEENTNEQQIQPSELTINDLSALRAIIDVASSRGAFKTTEFETIGKVYANLNNFLNAVAQQNAEQNAESTEEPSQGEE